MGSTLAWATPFAFVTTRLGTAALPPLDSESSRFGTALPAAETHLDHGRRLLPDGELRRGGHVHAIRAVVALGAGRDPVVPLGTACVAERAGDTSPGARIAHQAVDVEHDRGLAVRLRRATVGPDRVRDLAAVRRARPSSPARFLSVRRVELAVRVLRRRVPVAEVDAERVRDVRDRAAVVAEPAQAVAVGRRRSRRRSCRTCRGRPPSRGRSGSAARWRCPEAESRATRGPPARRPGGVTGRASSDYHRWLSWVGLESAW